MTNETARKLRFLGLFAAYFAGIWLLWNTAFVYPVKLFVVLLHEISHGLAAVVTGGEIRAIEITPRQGGVCVCPGGSPFLTLSAGYLGSLLWGGLMFWGANRFRESSHWLTAGIGLLIAAATILYVRQPFALAFGLAFGGALIALGVRAGPPANRVALTALGLTSCLYAILDIKSDVLDRPGLRSDAAMLSELTLVPTAVWGVVWIALALAFCFVLFRWAWRRA